MPFLIVFFMHRSYFRRKYTLKSILHFAHLYILFNQSFIFMAICTNRVSVNSACFIFEKESNIAGRQSLIEKSRNLELQA
jgi:hypothetical protein